MVVVDVVVLEVVVVVVVVDEVLVDEVLEVVASPATLSGSPVPPNSAPIMTSRTNPAAATPSHGHARAHTDAVPPGVSVGAPDVPDPRSGAGAT